jgi:hypothetical protein
VGARPGGSSGCRGFLRPCPQPLGWRRLVFSFQAVSEPAPVACQPPPTARSGRLACCSGASPVCLSIVSLLVLYYSSIVPLFLTSFTGSNGAGAYALPTSIPKPCRLVSGDCEAAGIHPLILKSGCQLLRIPELHGAIPQHDVSAGVVNRHRQSLAPCAYEVQNPDNRDQAHSKPDDEEFDEREGSGRSPGGKLLLSAGIMAPRAKKAKLGLSSQRAEVYFAVRTT